jgi:NitT/TauT family transport system substrate-binding protein
MASAAAVLARAAIANAHLDPNKDVSFVVVGLGAQSLTLLNNQQVDALSQFDMQYAFLANSGIPMRTLPTPEMEKFPGNGFIALEDTLKSRRKEAVALARGYAMGTIYSIANPAAAIKLLWREYPQTKPAGKEPAKALSDEVNILNARIVNWKLERGGVTRWGESSIQNYQAYLDFLLKHNVMKEKVSAADIIDNTLLTEINDFDINKLIEQAKQAKE